MIAIDPLRLMDPACCAEHCCPHDEWALLRREAPVSKIEAPGWPAYWANTRHADIVENRVDARAGAQAHAGSVQAGIRAMTEDATTRENPNGRVE